ncbi:MAG: lipopolysaccharide heptosyltransferase I [Proteobacteria bacterium]|nr:lipopolysaccharide heptosyltransferase I [Pseudomonadota bacterium]
MKVLLIKMSSLGDVVHALPAVTEAAQRVKNLELTWVVEEGFADIARAHPAVHRVIPVAIRRWRGSITSSGAQFREFVRQLRDTSYDRVIDTQGLIKSAAVSLLAHGSRAGYSEDCAREPLAAWCYRDRYRIAVDQHAIDRQKQLMAAALGYEADETVDYGLIGSNTDLPATGRRRLLLLHGTTWPSKEWPLSCWQALAALAAASEYELLVPAGSESEARRAAQILGKHRGRVLAGLSLAALMAEIRDCQAVVSVDTGLGHLAPALGVPVIGLFGATSPTLTGMKGSHASVLVSDHIPCIPCRERACQYPKPVESSSIYPPCMEQTTPEKVWQLLQRQIGSMGTRPD